MRFTIACVLFATTAAGEMIVETAETSVPAGYIVELPDGFDSTRSYPLVVALHGLGDRMESYAGTAARLCPEGAIGLYPESPYPLPSEEAGPPAFTWEIWTDSTNWLQGAATVDASVMWILDAIGRVMAKYAVDPDAVFLFGFSQGGMLTYRVGLRRPGLFAGLLPAGGWLPSDPAAVRTHTTPVRILHGTRDEVCGFAGATSAYDSLSARGVPVELLRYPVGHTLPPELFEDARDFVWRILHRGEEQSLRSLLFPEDAMFPAERNEQLLGVLGSDEPSAKIADGLMSIYENEPAEVKERVIYLLGARRCAGAEDFLRGVLAGPAAPELRQAAYSALVKLGTETAWETVDATEMEVAVRQVAPGSQAELAGLQPGDVLVSYDGNAISAVGDLRTARDAVAEGKEEVIMVIRRDGKERDIPLNPGQIGIWTTERPR